MISHFRNSTSLRSIHGQNARPPCDQAAPTRNYAPHRQSCPRIDSQWRIGHFLFHLKPARLLPFFLRDGFVGVSRHKFRNCVAVPTYRKSGDVVMTSVLQITDVDKRQKIARDLQGGSRRRE